MVRYVMVLAIGFVVSAQVGAQDSKDEAVKKERTKMAGTWKVVSWEEDGKKQHTDEVLGKLLVTIDAEDHS